MLNINTSQYSANESYAKLNSRFREKKLTWFFVKYVTFVNPEYWSESIQFFL